jgi:BCCT, betaine/carnitine/choline family transporter
MAWSALIIIFFITSSDSGSFFDDRVTSGGNPLPRVANRVFWGVSEAAAVLLLAGGLKAARHINLCRLDTKYFPDFLVCVDSKGSSPRISEALEDQGHAMLDYLSMRVANTKFSLFLTICCNRHV